MDTMRFSYICLLGALVLGGNCHSSQPEAPRPHILIAISDDQSWPHAGAYGSTFVETPAFDRVAGEGVLFTQAFSASPGCAPARAALVTGRYPWQNGPAGTHASVWPERLTPLSGHLEAAGYLTGYTGKGVGPFQWAMGGSLQDPAGPEYNEHVLDPPAPYLSPIDYSANFKAFLRKRAPGQPFCFWYGATEPHRPYASRAPYSRAQLDRVAVPAFLPDNDSVRGDLLAYAQEIAWFDRHLGDMLRALDAAGELDNTIVIVTSDNGMPFPGAKATCYEYGIHVPLAVRWGARVKPGQVIDALVSFVDVVPTILDLAGLPLPVSHPVAGRSLRGTLLGDTAHPAADRPVFAARERHGDARWQNLGYPQRALRTRDYLYIRNLRPERWPAGAPVQLLDQVRPAHGYLDMDWGWDWGGSNAYLVYHQRDSACAPFVAHALLPRPGEQLFAVGTDPACMQDLAADTAYAAQLASLRQAMDQYLRETGDPRVVGPDPDIFETYPRIGSRRSYPPPGWATDTAWLEALLPRIGQDSSAFRRPTRSGADFLEHGYWRLERRSYDWALYDLRTGGRENLSARCPQTLAQLRDWHKRYHP
ncbi:MAG: sulfatase [Bacteroidia bacterium]